MPGGKTTETKQTDNQTTQPWAPTQPLLGNIVNQLGSMPTSVSPQQTDAMNRLYGDTSAIPGFAPQGAGLANDLFSSTASNAPMLKDAYSSYAKTLSPYLSSSYLDPMTTPGFSDAYGTMKNDITNSVNGQFAAAGRDLSPANSTALGRGLSQGLGGLLSDQFNKNAATQLGAGSSLFNAGGATAAGLTGMDQTALGNRLQGFGVGGALPGLATAPGMAQLGAANAGGQLPFQNLGWLQQALLPIAALGSQSSGTSNGTTTQKTDPTSNIIGGVTGGLGTLGATGAFGAAGWLTPLLAGI